MKKQIYIFVLCLILSLAFSQSSTFAIQNDSVVIFEPDVYEVCNGKPMIWLLEELPLCHIMVN